MTHLISGMKGVASKGPTYLWPNRIAIGCVTVVEGSPGESKATLTHDLTARVTTGRPMPNCTGSLPSGNVIILPAEDDPASTIRPILEAMGADLEKVFIFGKHVEPLQFPYDVEFLAQEIGEPTPKSFAKLGARRIYCCQPRPIPPKSRSFVRHRRSP